MFAWLACVKQFKVQTSFAVYDRFLCIINVNLRVMCPWTCVCGRGIKSRSVTDVIFCAHFICGPIYKKKRWNEHVWSTDSVVPDFHPAKIFILWDYESKCWFLTA